MILQAEATAVIVDAEATAVIVDCAIQRVSELFEMGFLEDKDMERSDRIYLS